MEMFRASCYSVLLLLLLVCFVGCGRSPQELTAEDVHAVQQVAEAFFRALGDQNLEIAVSYVLPDERASFGDVLALEVDGYPLKDLPEELKIKVGVLSVEEEERVVAELLNVEPIFMIRLKWQDGRWWVVQ